MKRYRSIVALLLVAALSGLIWVGVTHAQTIATMTGSHQTVNSTLYSTGKNVDVEGTINGDVYCVGQNVTISATIHGDVLCAAETIQVSGHIDGSLQLVAETATDNADVGGSLGMVAQTGTVSSTARVGRDISFAGQKLTMNGIVARDIAVHATTLALNGSVGRTVKFGGTNLLIGKSARVASSLYYRSAIAATVPQGASIHGGVYHTTPPVKVRTTRQKLASWAGGLLYFFAAFLLLGLALVLFIPQALRKIGEEPHRNIGKTLLSGFGVLALPPIVIVILLVTFVGIPLALMGMLAYILIGCLSIPAAAYFVGELIMSKSENAIITMVVGTFVLTFLLFLPLIGILVAIATYLVGAGSLVLAIRHCLPEPKYSAK